MIKQDEFHVEIYPCCEHCGTATADAGCTVKHAVRCMRCIADMVRASFRDLSRYERECLYSAEQAGADTIETRMYAYLAKHGPV